MEQAQGGVIITDLKTDRVLTEAKDGLKLNEHLVTGAFRSVLIPFWHGIGDVVMFLPILDKLRELHPNVKIDIGLCRGLDQETFVPDAILLDGDWREKYAELGYDLVYPCNFPTEDLSDTSRTKAETCCIEEVGIPPVCGHKPLKTKKLIAVHFQITSVPWAANAEPDVAKRVWDDIKEAGFIPVETHFQHVFHNPSNQKFDFVDNHVRQWTPKIETLMALLNSCHAFIGVVSGNFHMALSVLGPKKVMLLEKDLKAGHFTKEVIATADLRNYNGEVRKFLDGLNASH